MPFEIVLYVALLIFLCFVFPVVLLPLWTINAHSYFARKGKAILARLTIVTTICIYLFMGYTVFRAFAPASDFYKSDFTSVLQTPFPEDAVIKGKSATFPDQHGHYSSICVFKTSAGSYEKLRSKFPPNMTVQEVPWMDDGRVLEN